MVSRDTTKDSSPLFLCDTVRKRGWVIGNHSFFHWSCLLFLLLLHVQCSCSQIISHEKSSAQIDKKLDRIIELLEKQSKG